MSKKKKMPATKYGLSRKHTKRSARDFLDMDYVDSLSDSEKRWLDRFCREFYQASFNERNDRNLHNTKEARRKCYGENNSRNRDMWNQHLRADSDPENLSDEDPKK